MTKFFYRSVGWDGSISSGELTCPSRMAAVDKLSELGQTPITLRPAAAGLRQILQRPIFTRSKLSAGELTNFTDELAGLLAANLPLERSLQILIDLADKDHMRGILRRLLDGVRSGTSFAESLEKERSFGPAYCGIVRAGEATGALASVMTRLSAHLKRAKEVQDRLFSALVYPSILLVMIGVTMVLIVTFVLPQFETVFASAGAELPLATRAVMAIGTAVNNYFGILLLGFTVLGAGTWRILQIAAVRKGVDRLLLSDKFLFGLVMKSEVGRFSRMLGMLVGSGVSLPQALAMTRATVNNRVLSSAIADATLHLKEGGSLAAMLSRSGHFPGYALRMIQLGEETGRLADMLEQLAEVLDREVKVLTDRLLTALVPAVTILMGGLIAFFIGSVLVGITSINQLAY